MTSVLPSSNLSRNMVSENHHLTIDTESPQVDAGRSISRTYHHHTHIEVGSHTHFQQQTLPQQHHQYHHPHHHRLLNPGYQQKQFSRSRSRSPFNGSTPAHQQEDRRTAEMMYDGISPNALAQKLELLEAGQSHLQRDSAELQQKSREVLQDIMERLDKNANEQDPLDLDVSETTLPQEESQQLNPALLKDHRTLQQHHGNANIRHS